MKYTIEINNVSCYIIGAIIKEFRTICPRGIKANWTENKSKSVGKMKTGKIDVFSKYKKDQEVFETKQKIQSRITQLQQEAEAKNKAWREKQQEEQRKKQEEQRKAEEAARTKAMEEKFNANTFGAAFKKAKKTKQPKKIRWTTKQKVVREVQLKTTPFQPQGCWASGAQLNKPQLNEAQPNNLVVEKPSKLVPISTSLTPLQPKTKTCSWADLAEEQDEYPLDLYNDYDDYEEQERQEHEWAKQIEAEQADWAPEDRYDCGYDQYDEYEEEYNQYEQSVY